MRKILPFLSFVIFSSVAIAQTDSLWRVEFRELLNRNQDGSGNPLLFEYSDSLISTGNLIYLAKLDSLSADTLHRDTYLSIGVEMEKYLFFKKKRKAEMAIQALNRFSKLLESDIVFNNEDKVKCYSYLANAFEATGNFFLVLEPLKRINDLEKSLSNSHQHSLEIKLDSLDKELSELKSNFAMEHKRAMDELNLFMLVGLGLAILVVALVILFFVSRSTLRKRLKALREKQADTSQFDELHQKMTEAKSESQQFRQTAQLTVNKLNSMDVSHRKAIHEVKGLHDEIQTALAELKQHNDSGKGGMSPATYMAIQNVIARFGASSSQRMNAISNELK